MVNYLNELVRCERNELIEYVAPNCDFFKFVPYFSPKWKGREGGKFDKSFKN